MQDDDNVCLIAQRLRLYVVADPDDVIVCDGERGMPRGRSPEWRPERHGWTTACLRPHRELVRPHAVAFLARARTVWLDVTMHNLPSPAAWWIADHDDERVLAVDWWGRPPSPDPDLRLRTTLMNVRVTGCGDPANGPLVALRALPDGDGRLRTMCITDEPMPPVTVEYRR